MPVVMAAEWADICHERYASAAFYAAPCLLWLLLLVLLRRWGLLVISAWWRRLLSLWWGMVCPLLARLLLIPAILACRRRLCPLVRMTLCRLLLAKHHDNHNDNDNNHNNDYKQKKN